MRTIKLLLLILVVSGTGPAQTIKPVLMPQVRTIAEGVVWRISDNLDENGNKLPPWKEIKIANVFGFKKAPVVDEPVTVIPLDVDIAPLELRITKSVRTVNGCNEKLPPSWIVELGPIKQREIFEIAPTANRAQAYPFDVCVIYPAVKFARQVKKNKLTKNMLPKGVAIETVNGAIDLTSDGFPDVLLVEYCCGSLKKPAGECDYTCGKTFKKIKNIWKLIDSSAPC